MQATDRGAARHALLLVSVLGSVGTARADDGTPDFNRPGIAFAASSLPQGGFAWEQGLPDADTDRDGGIRTTDYVADTRLRYGVTDRFELRLGVDAYGYVDVRGNGLRAHAGGGGDTTAGVTWSAPRASQSFSLAVQGTATVARGTAPVGGGGDARDVGVVGAWALRGDRSVSLYADRSWSNDGNGWLFATSYGWPLRDDLNTYVEAGFGTGSEHLRAAGGGVTWSVAPRVQLDASFLRGLDRDSPDWQFGIGFSIYFAHASAAR